MPDTDIFVEMMRPILKKSANNSVQMTAVVMSLALAKTISPFRARLLIENIFQDQPEIGQSFGRLVVAHVTSKRRKKKQPD